MCLASHMKRLLIKTDTCLYGHCIYYSIFGDNWLTGMFLQITRAGRGGQTGLRWRGAATQPWGKPPGISWPELPPCSLSTGGWTGHPNMVEIGSPERRWYGFCCLLDCVAKWYAFLVKEVNPKRVLKRDLTTLKPGGNSVCSLKWITSSKNPISR